MGRPEDRIRALASCAAALTLGLACTTAPRPIEFEAGRDGPDTADGLYRVRASRVAAAYLKPGAVFARYDQVMIDPVTVSYRRGQAGLSPESMAQLKDIFQKALERQIGRSSVYTVATERGPSTLRVSGHLVDLVVRAPPSHAREMIFQMDAGEMTLLLDVRDSQSGEPLARVADRRRVRPESAAIGGMYQSTPVNNWGAVREITANWARVLREGLEDLHTLPVPSLPPTAVGG